MASLCCCCFSGENADDERRPLLQPAGSTQPTTTESARLTRPAPTDTAATTHSGGRLEMRRVGMSELDQRFSDVAETFNQQRAHHQALTRCVAHLRQSCGCNHDNTLLLSECVKKIRDEHGLHYRIALQMKGYDFHLSAAPVESTDQRDDDRPPPPPPPPRRLRSAQDALSGASQAAKMTVSLGTKLQELIGWLLRSEERLAGQVARGAANHQERQRLQENLQACLRETRRGRELSLGYKRSAGEVLSEAAQLAGVEPS